MFGIERSPNKSHDQVEVYLEFLLELVGLGFSKLGTLLSLLNVSLDENQFAGDFFVPWWLLF